METRYKRELNHNYLIIAMEEEDSNYQLKMLLGNQIEGLLKVWMKQVDGKREFYYEISSRQQLSRLLEIKRLSAAELKELVLSLASVLKRVEEYLLPAKQLVLDPEYIYVNPETFRFFYCCLPGYEDGGPKAVQELMRYLLDRVNYQDQEAVTLVYRLYQETMKENFRIEDLAKSLYKREKAAGLTSEGKSSGTRSLGAAQEAAQGEIHRELKADDWETLEPGDWAEPELEKDLEKDSEDDFWGRVRETSWGKARETARERERVRDSGRSRERERARDTGKSRERERRKEREGSMDGERPKERERLKERERPKDRGGLKDRERPKDKERLKERASVKDRENTRGRARDGAADRIMDRATDRTMDSGWEWLEESRETYETPKEGFEGKSQDGIRMTQLDRVLLAMCLLAVTLIFLCALAWPYAVWRERWLVMLKANLMLSAVAELVICGVFFFVYRCVLGEMKGRNGNWEEEWETETDEWTDSLAVESDLGDGLEFREEEEDEEPIQWIGETVILSQVEETGTRRRLVPLEEGATDGVSEAVINSFPFVIGKSAGLADLVLPYTAVSRMHARIDRHPDGYQITDLNSTNGTRVGDQKLEANGCAPLRVGDEIWIANVGFRFE